MNLMDVILKRRSIRRYRKDAVPEGAVEKILEAGMRTPSASGLYTFSIIWVRDEEKRKMLKESCGNQPFILEAPVTLTVCADVRKLTLMMKAQGYETSFGRGLGWRYRIFSVTDAAMAAQNMTLAAECLGLGSVYIGGALANPRIVEALKLPKGVLPLFLLCVGYPAEEPPLRPKMLREAMIFIDEYRDLTEDEMNRTARHMVEKLKEEGYYSKYSLATRAGYTWLDGVRRQLTTDMKADEALMENLRRMGYAYKEPIL